MSERIDLIDVAVDVRTAGAEAVYTYRATPGCGLGQAVLVPLGPRTVIGYVIRCWDAEPHELGFRTKTPSAIISGLCLPERVIRLVEFVAEEYLCGLPSAISPATPPNIQDRLVTTWRLISEPSGKLTPSQEEILQVIRDQGGTFVERKAKPIASGAKKAIKTLRDQGVLVEETTLAPNVERHRLQGLLRLTSDLSRVEQFIAGQGKKKPAQAHTLMQLQGSETTSLSPSEIKALSGATDQTLKSLLQAGLLEEVSGEAQVPKAPPTLNPPQAHAVRSIVDAIQDSRAETFLLYGVTGSGKTEVFLHAGAEALKQGRQVLYLVPEISLTAQVIAHLRERFGRSVAVLHSNLSPQERLANWQKVATGQAPVVLGPRSALFAPFSNLGLIIVDEEHEGSYKQEQMPRYHTRTAARELARIHSCPVVLGSATPSIETAFAAEQGIYTELRLPARAIESARLPAVFIENLTDLYKEKKLTIFSDTLRTKIVETLERKEQIILFLNRRAFAPFLSCRECGITVSCPHCSVTLSYHKRQHLIKCHQCGHQRPAPSACPNCGGAKIAPFGTGVEKVEEFCRLSFPEANVARLDRDVLKVKGALEETFARFRAGDIDILVGTQVVAKGLDFPNVTLVGVIAADISLNLPDFRASETTFQLLSQVAGRAGRGKRPGEVVIQTLQPDAQALVCAQNHDFDAFYHSILEERRALSYPPFCTLINIIYTGKELPRVQTLADEATAALTQYLPGAEVLGPVDCPYEKLNDLWRHHTLIKMPPDAPHRQVGEALERVKVPAGCTVTIDVDPYSLM